MAIKLAQQGLNVIIAAVDNADLKGTVAELQRDFPMQSFKGVAVDLTGDPKVYMDAIRQATDSLTVQVLDVYFTCDFSSFPLILSLLPLNVQDRP